MSQHTPGVWAVEPREVFGPRDRPGSAEIVVWDEDSEGYEIVVRDLGFDDATAKANAHLIAAAPRIFSALTGLISLYETDEGCRSTSKPAPLWPTQKERTCEYLRQLAQSRLSASRRVCQLERELTADLAQWLVLNRARNLEPWLRAVPASVVRRIGLAAMKHDAALANAKGENL